MVGAEERKVRVTSMSYSNHINQYQNTTMASSFNSEPGSLCDSEESPYDSLDDSDDFEYEDSLALAFDQDASSYLIETLVNARVTIDTWPKYITCYKRTPDQIFSILGQKYRDTQGFRIYTDKETKETRVSLVRSAYNYVDRPIDPPPSNFLGYGTVGVELLTRAMRHLGVSQASIIPDGIRRFRLEHCTIGEKPISEILSSLPKSGWELSVSRKEYQYYLHISESRSYFEDDWVSGRSDWGD